MKWQKEVPEGEVSDVLQVHTINKWTIIKIKQTKPDILMENEFTAKETDLLLIPEW